MRDRMSRIDSSRTAPTDVFNLVRPLLKNGEIGVSWGYFIMLTELLPGQTTWDGHNVVRNHRSMASTSDSA